MQELISNLINTFNIILKEHLDETKYDKSISVDDVKNYLDELAIDIYAIKRIENYLDGVDISPELTELIKQFKMVIAFNEEQNVFDKEQLDKYRQIGVYDSIRSRLLRKIYLLKQDKKAKEFCLRNKQECLRLISFLNKLDGTRIIGERNLYRFYNFLNRLELPAEQLFEINMLLLQYNISVDSNLELNTKQDIVESITSFNLTKEQAIQIFENYGYDFNLVDTTIKEDLLAFGTMDGLNSMFMYFKEIEITHNIKFDEKNNKLVNLLFRSNPEVIESVIALCEDGATLLQLLDNMPSVFVKKGKADSLQYRKKNPLSRSKLEKSGKIVAGCHEDFEKNIKTFKSLGFDIKEILAKNADILTLSNERILLNIAQLKMVGIDLSTDDKDNFKLSALKSTSILLTADKFIELGEIDYLLSNTSRFIFEPDSIVFYRLFHLKNYNKKSSPEIAIYHDKGKTMYKGYITNPNNNELGINESNKSKGLVENCNVISCNVFGGDLDMRLQEEIYRGVYTLTEIDPNILNSSIVRRLDDAFKKDNLTYEIGGVLISRQKFIRNYMILEHHRSLDIYDIVKYCLLNGSIYTAEELRKIEFPLIGLDLSSLKR